jgi:hypothetical protein
MQDQIIWEMEVEFLAQNWQPLYVQEVVAYYKKRMLAVRSPETAFAQTYAKFFLNPSAQELQQ